MRFIFCLDDYFVGIYTVLNIVSRNVKSPFYIALLTIQIDSKQFYSDKKWMQHFFCFGCTWRKSLSCFK